MYKQVCIIIPCAWCSCVYLCFANTHECLKYKPGERSDKVVGAVGDIEDRNGKTVGLVSTGSIDDNIVDVVVFFPPDDKHVSLHKNESKIIKTLRIPMK